MVQTRNRSVRLRDALGLTRDGPVRTFDRLVRTREGLVQRAHGMKSCLHLGWNAVCSRPATGSESLFPCRPRAQHPQALPPSCRRRSESRARPIRCGTPAPGRAARAARGGVPAGLRAAPTGYRSTNRPEAASQPTRSEFGTGYQLLKLCLPRAHVYFTGADEATCPGNGPSRRAGASLPIRCRRTPRWGRRFAEDAGSRGRFSHNLLTGTCG